MAKMLFVSFGLVLVILIFAGDYTLRFGECFESERNSGFVRQYTEEFWSIVCQESLRLVLDELQMYTVRFDLSGKVSTLFWSTIRYRVNGFTLVGYEQPTESVSLTKANGFLEKMSLPVLKFRGKYTLDLYSGPWFQYSRQGAISVTISGTTIRFRREVTFSEDRDRMKWTSHNCSASIKDIAVDLEDPISNSLIAGVKWDEEIRLYQEQFCALIKLSSTFEKDLSINFTNDIYLNQVALRQPEIYNGYLEFHYIAEVRYRADENRFTHSTQPLLISKPTAMVVYGMSDFVFNSFGYVVHNHKLLSFTYTQLDLPEKGKHLLDTTCELECFGKLFPTASKRWPDSSVEIVVTTAEPPYVQIAPDSFKVIFRFNIEAYARLTNDSAPFIFSIHLNMSARLSPSAKNNRIRFEMQHKDANITIIESRIGHLQEDRLLVVISQAFQSVFVPLIKQFTIDGFELDFEHLLRGVTFNEYEFNFMKGDLSLLISSVDVKERKSYIDLTSKLLTPKHVTLLKLLFYTISP